MTVSLIKSSFRFFTNHKKKKKKQKQKFKKKKNIQIKTKNKNKNKNKPKGRFLPKKVKRYIKVSLHMLFKIHKTKIHRS